jgi:chromosome segregation ATPase
VEADVAALSRRIMLMEEEAKKSEQNLADTVTKLALSSKEADQVLKKVKVFESKCMNNEVTIEELDKNLRATTKMASDNEQKLDELSRKLGVQEDELKRAVERAELAENKLKSIEEELQTVGENMKQLEKSAEKAVEREEKLKDKILQIQHKYKAAEGRYEVLQAHARSVVHILLVWPSPLTIQFDMRRFDLCLLQNFNLNHFNNFLLFMTVDDNNFFVR